MNKYKYITRLLFWSSISILSLNWLNQKYNNQLHPQKQSKENELRRIVSNLRISSPQSIQSVDYARNQFKYIPENDGKLILFEKGSSELKLGTIEKLDILINVITEKDKIVIEGFTDDTGSENINQTISFERAKSVYNYFVYRLNLKSKKDIDISYIGLGEDSPNVPNKSEIGRKLNRRVEITVTKNSKGDNDSLQVPTIPNPDGKLPSNENNGNAYNLPAWVQILIAFIAFMTFIIERYESYKSKKSG